MQFHYLDPLGKIHSSPILTPHAPSIIDIDLAWLTLGYRSFPHRLHAMACFEKITQEVPEDHQFTFRQWTVARTRSTCCVWYSLPKSLLNTLEHEGAQVKSLLFVVARFFPPSCRNKAVICFVDIPGCEAVMGFIQGHCVCFKKLPAGQPLRVQHEWQYFQQAYPQWTFDHSVYLTPRHEVDTALIQTHQHTIHLGSSDQPLNNRIMLYGLH